MSNGGFGFTPRCAICKKELTHGMDMHEAIITRGDISGQALLKRFIMVKENCVLVCPGGSGSKCHRHAESDEGKIKCITHILMFVSVFDVEAFLTNLDTEMKGNQAKEGLRLLSTINKEVIHG